MIPALAQRFEQFEQLRTEFWDDIAASSPEQRLFKPKPDAWSMLQVAQHIIAAEEATLLFVSTRQRIKSSFWGRWRSRIRSFGLKLFLLSPLKAKAPNVPGLVPDGSKSYEQLSNHWDAVREQWRQFLTNFEAEHLEDVVFKHPIAGKFNLLQTIDDFMAPHISHHLQQLQRIKASPDFPS
ncbi:MAG: DinB family protein [Chitinophagales bacterium]|nr:DinB family protein [Chitinophagales bacterium]